MKFLPDGILAKNLFCLFRHVVVFFSTPPLNYLIFLAKKREVDMLII
jgi:hypothetical protein